MEQMAKLTAETYTLWTRSYRPPRCGLEGIVSPGLIRNVLIQGSKAAIDRFAILAAEVGECVRGLGPAAHVNISRHSIDADDAVLRWVYAVFDLAWAQASGSPLTAPRHAFIDGHSVRYDPDNWRAFLGAGASEEGLWLISKSQLQELVDHPPESFSSEIADLMRASVHAIDLIARSEESRVKDQRRWLTVTEAARALKDVVSGITLKQAQARVSKAANDKKFRTNGKKGRDRLLERDSFSSWLLGQRAKDLSAADAGR